MVVFMYYASGYSMRDDMIGAAAPAAPVVLMTEVKRPVTQDTLDSLVAQVKKLTLESVSVSRKKSCRNQRSVRVLPDISEDDEPVGEHKEATEREISGESKEIVPVSITAPVHTHVGCEQCNLLMSKAIDQHDISMIKTLIFQAFDLNSPLNALGETALFRAVSRAIKSPDTSLACFDVVILLFKEKASPHIPTRSGETAYTKALNLFDIPKRIEFLRICEHYDQLPAKREQCEEVKWAIAHDNTEIIKKMVQERFDVNTPLNCHYETALFYAMVSRNIIIIELLITLGANPHIRTTSNITAYELAMKPEQLSKKDLERFRYLCTLYRHELPSAQRRRKSL